MAFESTAYARKMTLEPGANWFCNAPVDVTVWAAMNTGPAVAAGNGSGVGAAANAVVPTAANATSATPIVKIFLIVPPRGLKGRTAVTPSGSR